MVARDGGVLEDKYRRTHDPFVALAFAAAATKDLIVGTSVCLVIEHDPIVLAKEISSLDLLSGGRFVFGVGAGWNKQEMLNHGTDPATRHGNMRERVEAMRAIWTTRRRPSTTASTWTSTRSGSGPSPRLPRRCSSAATARASRTACCATATAGCRT